MRRVVRRRAEWEVDAFGTAKFGRCMRHAEVMVNRLAGEQSPYLLQHSDNPVDWYPWGPEALGLARDLDRPLLVSIGYSACHWCHVMERESFEDRETAELMNRLFVNVKVDREERPDVDSIYMHAVQAMTGHGGWPLNVFLMPDGRPFWGGTYFPPAPRQGMPSWQQVLLAVDEAFRQRHTDVVNSAASLTQAIREGQDPLPPTDASLTPAVLRDAYARATEQFDLARGGFGGAPKFPQPLALEFMLRMFRRTGEQSALQCVELTLQRMAGGGIFDQLGGGFHRYSVDANWVVPHFEKMLYDNSLLALVYIHAFQLTGNAVYRTIVEKTLDYILREMTSPDGGFFSAQDADSEGVEGKYYVWTPEDLRSSLSEREADVARLRYGVTEYGNFEGKTILTIAMDVPEIATRLGVASEEVQSALSRVSSKLLEVRSERVEPAKDTKVLLSWNALAIKALATAGRVLERQDYLESAVRAVDFLYASMRRDGAWVRSFRDRASNVSAFLEDYSFLLEALLTLYETVWEPVFLQRARSLADEMVSTFWDDAIGGFFDSARDADELVVRPRNFFDNPIPSGNAAASYGLLRLWALSNEESYRTRGVAVLNTMRDMYARAPLAFGHLLCALDFHLSRQTQIAIVGEGDAIGTQSLTREVFRRYLPGAVMAVGLDELALEATPLLRGRNAIHGKATAYVCEHFACKLPVTEPEMLAAQLDDAGSN